ncbi:MAG: SCO family protein [Myxococcales bacterium]|nr:MAG: SCO family protein [Myxococcales bacterium]
MPRATALVSLSILCAVNLLVGGCGHQKKAEEALPILANVPNFELRDELNRSFSPTQLRGKAWVTHFFFTSCPSVCPLLMTKLSNFHHKTQDIQMNYQIVSITVDPETDDPKTLSAYAKTNHYASPNWTFLTGDSSAIRQVAVSAFKQSIGTRKQINANSSQYDILHGTHLVLVDKNSRIRGFFANDNEGFTQLEKALRLLLEN